MTKMKAAGLQPNESIYNTMINVCGKGGQHVTAIKLLSDLKAVGLQPDQISYNSAIDACAKCGQLDTAMALLYEMKVAGLQPNEISYTAAIDACSKVGQYEIAIKSLHDMKAAGLQPNEISYTAVIDACKNTGSWQFVLGLLQQMKADGLMPGIHTYTAAVDALQAGEQYHTADVLYAEVLSRGLRQHWSVKRKGMLDFHEYSIGMALAALRSVLQDMCSYDVQSDSTHHVHNPATDLVIITGHASSRQDRDGSILQPCIIDYWVNGKRGSGYMVNCKRGS
jgi:pentatricopeptide repeat protein